MLGSGVVGADGKTELHQLRAVVVPYLSAGHGNSDAIDTMTANTFQALQIDVGTAFLPAKKEVSLALIDFMNQLWDMPELGQIAEQLASLFIKGVEWAGESLKKALLHIKQALDYLVNNGPQVVKVLGKMVGVFGAMKFAPEISTLLLGTKSGAGSTATRSGGVAGMLSGL